MLKHEFFINGEYRNTIRMCIFQHQYLERHKTPGGMVKPSRAESAARANRVHKGTRVFRLKVVHAADRRD